MLKSLIKAYMIINLRKFNFISSLKKYNKIKINFIIIFSTVVKNSSESLGSINAAASPSCSIDPLFFVAITGHPKDT